MIRFSCPHCAKHLKAENHLVQRKTRCPACQTVILVPKSIGQLAETDQPVEVKEEFLPTEAGVWVRVQGESDRYPAVPAGSILPGLDSSDLRQQRARTALFLVSLLIVLLAVGVPVLIVAIKSAPAAKPPVIAQGPDRPREPEAKPQPIPPPRKEPNQPGAPGQKKPDDWNGKLQVPDSPWLEPPKSPHWDPGDGTIPDFPGPPAQSSPPPTPFPLPGARKDRIKLGYDTRQINGFRVLLSTQAESEGAKLNGEPFQFLTAEFAQLVKTIPAKPLAKIRRVTFQIDWDNQDPDPPRTVSRYRPATGMIEILSLKKMIRYKQALSQPRLLLLHDLAYVYHGTLPHGFANPDVLAVYHQAIERGLYQRVQHEWAVMGPAFAATSHLEYFAELSCAYLDRGRCFPFTRDELKAHDPSGYELMEAAWNPKQRR